MYYRKPNYIFLKVIIFSTLLWMLGFKCHAQNPPQKINADYQFKAGGFDSTGRMPKRRSVYNLDSGAISYNGPDSSFYVWTGHQWIKVGGTGGTPANPNTSVQFNNSGSFGGSSSLLWDNVHKFLSSDSIHTHFIDFIGDTTVRVLTIVATKQGPGFGTSIDQTFVNPDGRTDNVYGFNLWNMVNDGGRISNSFPAYGEFLETIFHSGGSFQMERHWTMVDTLGNYTRIKSWLMPFGNGGVQELNHMSQFSYFEHDQNSIVDWFSANDNGSFGGRGHLNTLVLLDTISTDGQFAVLNTSDGSTQISNPSTGSNNSIHFTNAIQIQQPNSALDILTLHLTQASEGGVVVDGTVSSAFGTFIHPSCSVSLRNVLQNEGSGISDLEIRSGGSSAWINFISNPSTNFWQSGIDHSDSLKYKVSYNGANDFSSPAIVANINQQVSVNDAVPLPSAQLQVSSTARGFLPPRMTTVQKLAIVSPAEGLHVYDLTLHQGSYFNGTIWINY